MKNKKLKRFISVGLILCILASIGIGAYLTSTDVNSDIYTVGNVSAEIIAKGDMELDNVGALLPGTKHIYERAAKNTGINDAYVFMSLTIPYEMVGASSNDGTQIGERTRQLFIPGVQDGYIGSEWKIVDVGYIDQYKIENNGQYCGEHDAYSAVVGDTITFIYGFIGDNADGTLKVLKSGETTSNLVETMELTNLYSAGKIDGEISTRLYAIQDKYVNGGLNDANGVWAVINKAICGEVQETSTLTYSINNTNTGDAVGYAPLRLVNENGHVIATSVANEDGNGQFQNVPAGQYSIETDVGNITIANTARMFAMRRTLANRSASIEITGEDKSVHLNLTTIQNTLVQGPIFNTYIPDEATSVEFIAMPQTYGLADRTLPADAVDVSEAADGSVMAWVEGTTMYVAAMNGEIIYANPNCNGMFQYKSNLTHIGAENLSMENVASGYDMFAQCRFLDNDGSEFDFSNMRGFDGAFMDCAWLTTYTLPEGTTVIPYAAFMSTGITSINIPFSVTKIDMNAFAGCTQLKSLTIPSSVEYIGDMAFAYCNSLTSITIPASITELRNEAFAGCEGLTTVIFEDGFENISYKAFRDCINLTHIEFSNSLKFIDEYAFEGCSKLSSINLPASVETIKGSAFSQTNLTTFNVDPANEYYTPVDGILYSKDEKTLIAYPAGLTNTSYSIKNGVEKINNGAFTGNNKLTSITISVSVIEIDDYAFCNSKISSITFASGSNLKRIGKSAFANLTNLTNISIPSKVELIDDMAFNYSSKLATVSLVKQGSLTTIGNAAFRSTAITSINIPTNVENIGTEAFSNCSSLATVTFPSDTKLKSVGYNAFKGTSWLKNKNTNGQILTINNVLISGSTASGKVVIPDGTTVIPQNFFSGNKNITSVIIPNSVKSIEDDAFTYCSNLTSITIPNSVEYIGNGAFESCSNLTSVIFEEGSVLKTIDKYVFTNCSKLTSITIPDSVQFIGSQAFANSGLVSINIPANLNVDNTDITKIFRLTFSLTEINVSPLNSYYTSVNGVLFSKDMQTLLVYPQGKANTNYIIPEGVKTIGDQAFNRCQNIVSVTLSSTVETIGNAAFDSCKNLTSVTLPAGLKNVHSSAFTFNNNLSTINYCGTQAQWNNIWFDNEWINGPTYAAEYTIYYNYVPEN